MSKLHHNPIPVNNGVRLNGPAPIDDRFVIEDVADVFVNAASVETAKACELYGKIYKGANIVAMGFSAAEKSEPVTMILIDDTPYVQGKLQNVTAQNYTDYWKIIDHKIDAAESRLNDRIDTLADETENSLRQVNEHIDASVAEIYNVMDSSIHFDGAGEADNYFTIGQVGNIPAGTTIAQLKQKYFSEILRDLLFEFVTPTKTKSRALTTSLKAPYTGSVEVGTKFPTDASLGYTFTPETWNWQSKSNPSVIGTPKEVNAFSSVKYMYTTSSSATGGTDIANNPTYAAMTAKEGLNGYIYAQVSYVAGDNAVDSKGNDKNEAGEFYKQGEGGTQNGNVVSFTGAWKGFSNTGSIYTSASTAWADKNKDVTGYAPAAQNVVNNLFDANTETVYLRFPAATTDAQPFYVWCPASYSIQSVYAANEAVQNVFDDLWTSTLAGTETLTNSLGASGSFKKYSISKPAGGGLLSVMVTFRKG